MKSLIALAFLSLSSFSFAASTTVFQCAVDKIGDWDGARVNVIKTEAGDLKANFIQGTTVSGTMYHVKEIAPGVFSGTIKNKPQFFIELRVSDTPAVNASINGNKATLSVVYPSYEAVDGSKTLKTTAASKFVCGKKYARF